jgi:flagellar biosynthesis protein FliP
MEFTFEISWPALFLIFFVVGLVIDKKDKKPEKINNIESDNALKTFEEYHIFFKDFMKKNIESNKKLNEDNKNLKQRIHTMQTRSMTIKN